MGRIQALGNLVVARAPASAIGPSPPERRPAGGDLADVTTSRTPDRALYRASVAEALAANEPFVVTFATPLYCQSRTCGPVVDVVARSQRAIPPSVFSSTSRSTRTTIRPRA